MKTERFELDKSRGTYLTAYLQEVDGDFPFCSVRPAILVVAGGGYSIVSKIEQDPVATIYLGYGYQVFLLNYSVGDNSSWPNPLNDYEEAMRLIRREAKHFNVDPTKVASIGFSAGGHLVGMGATASKEKPNAAIIVYGALGDMASRLGKTGFPRPVDFVDENTPPCFLVAASDDPIVPLSNTLDFASKLAEKGVAFETHIFDFGGHGFGSGSLTSHSSRFTSRLSSFIPSSIGFLTDVMGGIGEKKIVEPLFPPRINSDLSAELSVFSTMKKLSSTKATEIEEIKPLFEYYHSIKPLKAGTPSYFVSHVRLVDLLMLTGTDKKTIASVESSLNKIRIG